MIKTGRTKVGMGQQTGPTGGDSNKADSNGTTDKTDAPLEAHHQLLVTDGRSTGAEVLCNIKLCNIYNY